MKPERRRFAAIAAISFIGNDAKQRRRSVELTGGLISVRQVVHGYEGIGMVGSKLRREGGLGFGEQIDRLLGVEQSKLRCAQSHLHPGHLQWVADRLGRCLVESLAPERHERLAILLDFAEVEIREHRPKNLADLLVLRREPLGQATSHFLGGGFGEGDLYLPTGFECSTLGPSFLRLRLDQAERRPDHAADQGQEHQASRDHLPLVPPGGRAARRARPDRRGRARPGTRL